jgi:hypothetical protein
MDLSKIKSKLADFNGSGDSDRPDFSANFWKPAVGKQTVRIVPAVDDPDYPFTEIKFHYNIAKFPMIALSNFGKQDPIEEFVKELRKTSDKDNWSLSGKISPRARIFAPVIVRGEEDQGVRLWGFGVKIYKALLALAEDEDIGDYTDPMNGWDLIIDQVAGNPFPETSIRIKPKQTPLSDDAKLVKNWLQEQPKPLESFTPNDYDFIKKQLTNYLNPSADEESPTAEDKPVAKTDFSLETATAGSKSTTEKFDDLFS